MKRIFRILKGTKDYGLWYKKDRYFELKYYIDVDWEGNMDDKRNSNSGALFLGGRHVTWIRKKETCIS